VYSAWLETWSRFLSAPAATGRSDPAVSPGGGGGSRPPAMSLAAAWCAQHRLRFLLPALFLAPVLYFLLSPPSSPPFFSVPASGELPPPGSRVIWAQRRLVEWRPCGWWQKAPTPAPSRRNGYVRIDCYGGLNQLRRDLCDGIGVARLLNATMVLPKFEVAAYWNESRYVPCNVK